MIKKFLIAFVVFAILISIVVGVGSTVSQSEQGYPDLLAKWFPSVFRDKSTTGPDPGETLQAPFIANGATNEDTKDQWGDLYVADESNDAIANLAVSHRPAVQVGGWLKEQVTFILSFAPENYETHRQEIRSIMSFKGFEEFEKFLNSTNLLGALKNGNRDLHSYILENPELIHEDAVEGRYRWLFAAPVNINLIPKGSENYEQDVNSVNREIMIQIQVGRIDNNTNDGMQIESWQIRKR